MVHMTFSRRTVKTDYTCVTSMTNMEYVRCARYLGVDISSGFTWNSHVDRITANANQSWI